MWLPTALSLTLAGARPATAQTTAPPPVPLIEPPEFALDQWTTQHGLPQNSVTAIVQTPDGYLWVGTFGGLARFDGTSFTLIERSDSAGRHVDRIRALAVAPDSALWIGTENGLLRYKNGEHRAYTTAHGLPDNVIRSVHVAPSGMVWIAGERGGITRLHQDSIQVFDVTPDAGTSFTVDRHGTLWVKAGSRFLTIDEGTSAIGPWRPPAPDVTRLELEDRAGAKWFSGPFGLLRVSGGGATARRFRRDEGVRAPSILVEDPAGGYWLGTHLDGLFYFDPDGGRRIIHSYPLPDGRSKYGVRSAYVDREGDVWVGTDADGLLRAKRNLFTTYTSAHGLSHDVITAVRGDAAGRIWVGTNCFGVNALDPRRHTVRLFKPRRQADPEGDPCIFALTEGADGAIWTGTWGGGLTRLVDGGSREERLKRSAGLADTVVLALFTDRDGTIWVGTNTGGLAALADDRGGVRAAYTTAHGLAHNSVRVIAQTRDGALWIGTLGGLTRLVDGRLTSYRARDGLSAEHVRAIYEDRAGDLWIGTYGGGLNLLRDGVFSPITRGDGLADDVVSTIFEDDHGFFWMSGNRGISRIARADLLAFVSGRLPRVHAVLYGAGDGLLNAETNGGFQPAGWRDAEGRLWFPTVQGVAMVDPRRVTAREPAPRVSVEAVVVNGVGSPPGASLVVGVGRANLEFRYTGLSLTAPQHLIFRYRLDGFDDGWVDAGSRRVAYYPRLPPGRYRFRVTAANRDGQWNETATELPVRVAAPVWGTWWFRLGALLLVIGLAAAVVRQRELAVRRRRAAQEAFSRQLLESQEHERKRLAGELHDGLGQELLVVKNRALLALQSNGAPGAVRDQLQQITAVVTQSLDTVRRIAHNLTPYHLDHLGLTAALRAMIDATAEATGIALDSAIDTVDGLLPLEAQINLFRIVQEGLSNIVRHSGAASAAVRVRRGAATIVVTIQDDGRGFVVRRDATGAPAGGFGLSGIAERVRILGGTVELVSAPARGTRLEVVVPLEPVASAS